MKLKDIVIFPNERTKNKFIRRPNNMYIYVPGMTEADWFEFENFQKDNGYDRYYMTRPNDYYWAFQQLQTWMLSSLKFPKTNKTNFHSKNLRMLDLGGGSSMWAPYVKRKYPNAYVKLTDIEPPYSKMTHQRWEEQVIKIRAEGIEVELVEAFDTIIEEKSFNCISMLSSIEHFKLKDEREFILRCVDGLEDGGLLLVTTDITGNSSTSSRPRSKSYNLTEIVNMFALDNFDVNALNHIIDRNDLNDWTNWFLFISLVKE